MNIKDKVEKHKYKVHARVHGLGEKYVDAPSLFILEYELVCLQYSFATLMCAFCLPLNFIIDMCINVNPLTVSP